VGKKHADRWWSAIENKSKKSNHKARFFLILCKLLVKNNITPCNIAPVIADYLSHTRYDTKKIDNHQDPCYPKGYRYRSIRTSSSSPQTLNYEKERLKRTFFFLYPKVSRLSDKSEPHRNGTSTCTQIS